MCHIFRKLLQKIESRGHPRLRAGRRFQFRGLPRIAKLIACKNDQCMSASCKSFKQAAGKSGSQKIGTNKQTPGPMNMRRKSLNVARSYDCDRRNSRSSTTLRAPTLRMSRARRSSTALWLIESSDAICRLVFPCATNSNTSCSF